MRSERERQRERLQGEGIFSNAQMSPRLIHKHCQIDAKSEKLLESAMTRLGLSARACDRILKVSRTVADLAASDRIRPVHVAEAGKVFEKARKKYPSANMRRMRVKIVFNGDV